VIMFGRQLTENLTVGKRDYLTHGTAWKLFVFMIGDYFFAWKLPGGNSGKGVVGKLLHELVAIYCLKQAVPTEHKPLSYEEAKFSSLIHWLPFKC